MTLDRTYPARPFLAASVAVFRDGRVLVASRSKPPAQGLFSLPGGLVEPGETLAQAALRELREEVGVEAEIVGFVNHVEIVERDERDRVRHHFVVCAHAARWVSGEPSPGAEAIEVRWVTQAELQSLPATPGLASLLGEAFARMERVGA
ncbi:NUDIX hydrolase [Salinarimonas soli]|uniref:NUDIX hydrolase n=1 Tax=Salinarimonas soli TaxID=1638099 RepID=UPI001F0B37F0|nr:NUDIX hydrolase [Salinarimonas soli]